MANDITTFGYRGFEASFGIDNSSVSRTIYLKDDTNLDDILKKLLGDGTATPFKPHECPERPGFYCTEVRVSPIDSKSCQGSINDNDYDTFLDTPIIFRGLELECTYTPIDTMWGVDKSGFFHQDSLKVNTGH